MEGPADGWPLDLRWRELDRGRARNRSFEPAVLEVQRHNSYLFESGTDNRVFQFLQHVLPGDVEPERGLLDLGTRQRILAHFEDENRALHAERRATLAAVERPRVPLSALGCR